MVNNISEEERHKIKLLFEEKEKKRERLMKENGTWKDYINDSVSGDSELYPKEIFRPCCSKCELSLWDTITFNDQYQCSPCNELPKYEGYSKDKKAFKRNCTPPEPEQS